MRKGHDIICRRCEDHFFVCATCFRGHVYCSTFCSETVYKERRKQARKKNASTQIARALHRIRNKNYRVYGRQTSTMMDPSSDKGLSQLIYLKTDCEHCAICKVRRANENLELFAVTPD